MLKQSKAVFAAAGIGVIACAVALAQGAKDADKLSKYEIDKPVAAEFKLRDVTHDLKATEKPDAAMVALSSFKDKKPVVLFFMSERCGTTWKYEKRLGQLMKKNSKDVAFMGVRCSANDSAESIRKFCETRNFEMPVLNDEKGDLSKFFKVTNTPTFTLIDNKGVVRYRGSFDDSAEESGVMKTYLADAVKAVLDSKEVAIKTTRPFG